MVMTTSTDRATRARRVRESVHAYFMWHTGRIPGITTEYLDARARSSSDMMVNDIEEERHWTMYSLNAQLSRMDRIDLSPAITLDAFILQITDVRTHIPSSFPEGMVPSNFCAPGEEIPLFQTVEDLLRAYRQLPTFLMYHYELVMEQITEVQEGYLSQVNFHYASNIENEHIQLPEYIISGPYELKKNVSQVRQSNEIGTMMRLEAQVIYTGEVNTAVLTAAFKCSGTASTPCDAVTYMIQDPYSDDLREPNLCAADDEVGGCGRKKGEVIFNLLSKPDSRTITYQMVQVQDVDSSDGTPRAISVELRGSLCGQVVDGGFVTIDGILMSRPTGRGKKTRVPYFYCTAIIENGKKREAGVNSEEEAIVRQWVGARSPEQVLADLAQEFCPQIHGYMRIKKVILLQSVGGLRIESQNKRGDLHVLLLGDPGVAKSQLLSEAVNLTPGSVLYDCSQASQAGLVAAAEKVKDLFSSGENWAIRAGALALTPDHSICALDEFHLLGSKDSSIVESLNVALEHQEVNISKAAKGKVTTRCAVLAAANPKTKNARFDPDGPRALWDQANIKVNTMSRFDYMAIIRDMEEEALDVNIAEAMWDAADPTMQMLSDNVFPIPNFMQKHVALAKRINTVFLAPDAKDYLVNTYSHARQMANAEGKVTPRRNESLRRFAQAVARLCLSDTITLEHAKIAEQILRTSMTDTHPALMDGGQTSKQEQVGKAILEAFFATEIDPKYIEKEFLKPEHVERFIHTGDNWPSNIDKPSKQAIIHALNQSVDEGVLQRKGSAKRGYVYGRV